MRRFRPFPMILGLFFALATATLLGTAVALLWPGTEIDAIWSLRPDRHAEMVPYRLLLGPGFLLLAVVMAAASAGCFACRSWARWLAMAIFAVNGLGDAIQLVFGHWLEGGIGIAVAGLLIWILSWSKSDFGRGSGALAPDSRHL